MYLCVRGIDISFVSMIFLCGIGKALTLFFSLNKKHNFASTRVHLRFFLCCPIIRLYVLSSMFGSSLPLFSCRMTHVLFTLCVYLCTYSSIQHIMCFCLFFCFFCALWRVVFFVFLRLVYPMLSVSLDWQLLITPSKYF